MSHTDHPCALAERLVGLFPSFAEELEGEEIGSYHLVLQRLAPMVAGYLEAATEEKLRDFGDLVSAMAEAGGERENAVSTCLLEHASQVGIRRLIGPNLSAAAKRELR